MTSDKEGAHGGDIWRAFPSYHRMVVERAGADPLSIPDSIQFSCEGRDLDADEPPLAVELDDDDIEAFLRTTSPDGSIGVGACTHYGPEGQDKSRNEDYALSACFADGAGGWWGVAAVADGVSTRTFWASRSSRLACLAAYRQLRRFSIELAGAPPPDGAMLASFRSSFVRSVVETLRRDQDVLLSSDFTPPKWAPSLYRRLRGRDELWYNTTLLVCLMGPRWGVLLSSGDGGIRLSREREGAPPEEKTVLVSTDDLAISSFLSLAFDETLVQISRIPVGCIDASGSLNTSTTVALGSDGVDRSWQLSGRPPNRDPYRPLHDSAEGSVAGELKCRIDELLQGAHVEQDNHSLAIVQWKLPATCRDEEHLPLSSLANWSAGPVPSGVATLEGDDRPLGGVGITHGATSGELSGSDGPQERLTQPSAGRESGGKRGTIELHSHHAVRSAGEVNAPEGDGDEAGAGLGGDSEPVPTAPLTHGSATDGGMLLAPEMGRREPPTQEAGECLDHGRVGYTGEREWLGVVLPSRIMAALKVAMQGSLDLDSVGVPDPRFDVDAFEVNNREVGAVLRKARDLEQVGGTSGVEGATRRHLIVLLADVALAERAGCKPGARRRWAVALLIRLARDEHTRAGETDKVDSSDSRFFHWSSWDFLPAEWSAYREMLSGLPPEVADKFDNPTSQDR